jgi:hypothetical protein
MEPGQGQLVGAVRAELRALGSEAMTALRDLLNPASPAPVRLRAALEVLRMVGADQPEPIGPETPADAERAIHERDMADFLDDLTMNSLGGRFA